MKVAKVINNNVISVMNDQQQELVVMGRGIGFQKKTGDVVDQTKVEKIFTLHDPEVNERFKLLLREIPLEVMEVTEKIIQHAKTTYNKTLNDVIYVALTDHIHFAIQRNKEGLEISNALVWEIQRVYKDEYEIGKQAVELINKQFGIHLPEDEAGFIAIHIVNAELNEEMPNMVHITKIIKQTLNIVKYHFGIDFDEESLNYFRFLTHLKFFAQRLLNKTYLESVDDDLFEMVKEKHKKSFECTEKIAQYIQHEYHYTLTNDEKLYLTVHIQRVTNR